MDTRTSTAAPAARTVRAPRGTHLHCKSWLIEAAYRMLQNNLDPDVAERPEDLMVYASGARCATGRASIVFWKRCALRPRWRR